MAAPDTYYIDGVQYVRREMITDLYDQLDELRVRNGQLVADVLEANQALRIKMAEMSIDIVAIRRVVQPPQESGG